tara:strand:+ start:374 stop:508 length:135 start_codon:yes stop_codon:yes gene_type:complete
MPTLPLFNLKDNESIYFSAKQTKSQINGNFYQLSLMMEKSIAKG